MINLLDLYKKLKSLTLQQKKIIESGDYEELLKILEKRQALIKAINKIDTTDFIKSQDNPKRVHRELQNTLEEIKEFEDENVQILENKCGQVKGNLSDLNRRKKGVKGYNVPKQYEAKFINKKS